MCIYIYVGEGEREGASDRQNTRPLRHMLCVISTPGCFFLAKRQLRYSKRIAAKCGCVRSVFLMKSDKSAAVVRPTYIPKLSF